jgi:hypothetical protein
MTQHPGHFTIYTSCRSKLTHSVLRNTWRQPDSSYKISLLQWKLWFSFTAYHVSMWTTQRSSLSSSVAKQPFLSHSLP